MVEIKHWGNRKDSSYKINIKSREEGLWTPWSIYPAGKSPDVALTDSTALFTKIQTYLVGSRSNSKMTTESSITYVVTVLSIS